MKIETLSTFPDMLRTVMSVSMMRIAQEKGLLEFIAHDLRDWTHDRHRSTDDDPYGGGQGLVMKCEPIFEAYDVIAAQSESGNKSATKPYTVFLSPVGEPFTEETACSLAELDHILFVCGHYEGIDERAYTLADKVISLGDYVLTSGELASLVVIDALVRKIPGVLGDEMSAREESFSDGLLEYPHYTRPASFRGLEVPEVLLSGNHAAINAWRREQSLKRTFQLRPDLLECVPLNKKDCEFINSLLNGAQSDSDTLS
ncbi:MAG: tRNA (guanosine(37)-N1)-methyltransferase TrmD [Eggerthellaceae bacterium]|nr:tRNA (guanosine(37)-N1)-methyltransferase TrmD [Eggerthellaceae bacterium]